MFDHNSKLVGHVHEHHHHMDFENVEVVGHEEHYHQRLFLQAWMSVKDPNAGNDHMVMLHVEIVLKAKQPEAETSLVYDVFIRVIRKESKKKNEKT